VLMSLLVARMITPLIAAYFLRSHGTQPHANWKWMDVYLKVLNWSLDTSKAHALLAKLPKIPRSPGYYMIGILLLLVIIAAFLGATQASMMAIGKLGFLPGAITFVLAAHIGIGVAYLVGKAIGWVVRTIGGG